MAIFQAVKIRETDLQFRCLQPDPLVAARTPGKDEEHELVTATHVTSAATPFSRAKNIYTQDPNP